MRIKFFLLPLIIVLADASTKYYFRSNTIDIGFLSLHFVKNYGAAFGILQNQKLFLLIIPIVALFIIAYYLRSMKKENILFYALLLLLGGTIGNLIDRIFFGYVIDFIDLGFWPVFNIADAANSIAALFIILSLISDKQNKQV